MVALESGQALGQLILRAGNTAPQIPFELASVLISLAIIPVCLTRATAPTLEDAASLPLRRLFEASPLGVAGAGITGLLLGAFYGLAAIYARRIGLNLGDTATFMMTVIPRSEEHTSELQSLMRISYAVFCLKKKTT